MWWCFLWWPIMTAECEVKALPPPKIIPPAKHPLGPQMFVAACVSPSGFEQIEKACKNCGAVRITVFAPVVYRAWRRTSEGPQIATTIEPPCGSDGSWPP